jgi:hypothetical protein
MTTSALSGATQNSHNSHKPSSGSQEAAASIENQVFTLLQMLSLKVIDLSMWLDPKPTPQDTVWDLNFTQTFKQILTTERRAHGQSCFYKACAPIMKFIKVRAREPKAAPASEERIESGHN